MANFTDKINEGLGRLNTSPLGMAGLGLLLQPSMSFEPINPFEYAIAGMETGIKNKFSQEKAKSEAELQGMRRNEYVRQILKFNQEQQKAREEEVKMRRREAAASQYRAGLEPMQRLAFDSLPLDEQAKIISAQTFPDAALGGNQPAGVQEFLFSQENPEYMEFRRKLASLSPEAQAAFAYGKAFQSAAGKATGEYESRGSAAETARVVQEGVETGRGAAQSAQARREKAPVLGAINYLAQQFLGDPSTNTPGAIDKLYSGGFMGLKSRAAPIIDKADRDNFESLQRQLSTQLRAIFRIPGEGTLSDREQADNNLMLPSVEYDPATNKTIMKNLLQIINIRASQEPEAMPTDSQVTQYPRGTVRERK